MRGSLPEQRSRLADAARLAGALSIPVCVLALLGALDGLVVPRALIGATVLGFTLALLALGLALCALTDIWRSGALGARSAFLGILYACPVLAVLAVGLVALLVYPRLDEVSTDPLDPPRLAALSPSAGSVDRLRAAAQVVAYPDIAPRLYEHSLAEVDAAMLSLINDRGWTIEGRETTEAVPGTPDGVVLRAAAPMPLLGISGTIVLRLRETLDGTRLDMRSIWGGGAHDLGENARRIRRFLADLDERLEAT